MCYQGIVTICQYKAGAQLMGLVFPGSVALYDRSLWIRKQWEWKMQGFLCMQVCDDRIGCNAQNSTAFLTYSSIVLSICLEHCLLFRCPRALQDEQKQIFMLLIIPGAMGHPISAWQRKDRDNLSLFQRWGLWHKGPPDVKATLKRSRGSGSLSPGQVFFLIVLQNSVFLHLYT
jgi:hypothetical protein